MEMMPKVMMGALMGWIEEVSRVAVAVVAAVTEPVVVIPEIGEAEETAPVVETAAGGKAVPADVAEKVLESAADAAEPKPNSPGVNGHVNLNDSHVEDAVG